MTGRASEMVIRAPDPAADREELYDLIAKVFSSGRGYYGFRDYCRNGYMDHSHLDWRATRVGLLDGRIVANYAVWDYHMRIGRCAVRVAGIGVVATHGDYRNLGLMDRLARACLDDLPGQGYDMTVLFGIPDFYHRFGYVPAWPGATYSLGAASLVKLPCPRLREFGGVGGRGFDALYNRCSRGLTGTAVRPTYSRNRNADKWKGHFWGLSTARPSGFVVVAESGTRLECVDAAGDAEAVLGAVGSLAAAKKAAEVIFPSLHWDSPLARRLRAHKCKLEQYYSDSGGAMIRICDLRRMLTKIAPELSRRLAASPLSRWHGQLTIQDARERVTLDLRGRVVVLDRRTPPSRHAVIGGEHVAQLIIGNGRPGEIISASGMRTTGDGGVLASVLWPPQHPMLGMADHF